MVSQSQISILLLYSMAIGALLGVVWDFFRVQRTAMESSGYLKNKTDAKKAGIIKITIVFFQDIIFWLIAAFVFTVFIYYINRGQVRGIAITACLAGFLVYYNTVGRIVRFFSEKIVLLVRTIIVFIYHITLRPVMMLAVKLIRLAASAVKKSVRDRSDRMWYKRVARMAGRGFGCKITINVKGKERAHAHLKENES